MIIPDGMTADDFKKSTATKTKSPNVETTA